ncbi:MAG: selenocysteine-specific translation elongation factor, partial [Actinomycetota bacterium]
VQALTGIDPDRLVEEKRRGLTIDLGFAWVALASGREVGLVDVPGHERFIKNMLAGVGAINVTLFVVAANEGWKPQSQEHLDILDLLEVAGAVVAVTKTDTVDAEHLAGVVADVAGRIEGTSLAGAPIVAVSAVTGHGLGTLVEELERVIEATPAAEDRARPRLWIDRVFTMKGSGTVVTGTLTGGTLAEGEEIEVLPEGMRARVRSIQSHGKRVRSIGPGNRTALNLVGVEPESVKRGDVVALPGSWSITDRIVTSIRFLPNLPHQPGERGAFKFYIGSVELDATLRFLEEPPEPGRSGIAAVMLSEAVALDWRDRFILRDAGRRETLGGGVVLEPRPRALRRGDRTLLKGARERLDAPDRLAYLEILLAEEGHLAQRDALSRTGLDPDSAKQGNGVWLSSTVFSEQAFEDISSHLVSTLRSHQRSHPREPGMPRGAMRATLGLDPRPLQEAVEELARRNVIVADATVLRTPDFTPALGGPEREALVRELEEAGAAPPSLAELGRRFDPALLRALIRAGELVQVSPDLVFAASAIERFKSAVAESIERSGPITVAQFRDLIQATRKYALPVLEYLDRIGFTRRQADLRVLGPGR